MAEEKKPDYSNVKTHGGVLATLDGEVHPTKLTDEGRAAQVQALKNERAAIAGRAEGEEGSATAKRRVSEIDKALAQFSERPPRGPRETA